jgi:hypothetical protein
LILHLHYAEGQGIEEGVTIASSVLWGLAGYGKTRFVVRQAHHERDKPLIFSSATVRPEPFDSAQGRLVEG